MMRKNGHYRFHRVNQPARLRLIERYQQGMTQDALAQQFGLSQTGVSYILRTLNIQTRTRAQYS